MEAGLSKCLSEPGTGVPGVFQLQSGEEEEMQTQNESEYETTLGVPGVFQLQSGEEEEMQTQNESEYETTLGVPGVSQLQPGEEMAKIQSDLNDLYRDATEYSCCVNPDDLKAITSLKEQLDSQETSDRLVLSNLEEERPEITNGDSDRMNAIHPEFGSGSESGAAKLAEWKDIKERIEFARTLHHHGVKYIGYGTTIGEEIIKDLDALSFVLYFTQQARIEEPERWNENRKVFFQEVEKQIKGNRFYAVDCDVHPEQKIGDYLSCVQVLQSGMLMAEDLLLKEQDTGKAKIPFVKASVGSTEPSASKPKKGCLLEIPCPGHLCNPTAECEWSCNKCQHKLEYGFDEYVYCGCGRTAVLCLEFKCAESNHGVNYARYKEDILIQLLHKLEPFQEMNILILGETGVGKSTWINGFINFLMYDSLEEAEKGDLFTLIPTEFTMPMRGDSGEFEEVTVRTGVDENEIIQPGHSATQDAKVHQFIVGKTRIRLVDTPGIGDTRGVEQDNRNFQNILATLSHLDEIHGICILLKPNNARLTVMFRFCIKELLTYLHRDASKNIMFCFTNTRGTFYRPGDTMPALKKLLKENIDVKFPMNSSTVYCYDSEAYRFLAAVKNQPLVLHPEEERLNYSSSWQRSITETKRMLEHIRSLPPHSTKNTLNLNKARQLVLRLARPLAEISRNIQTNKQIVIDKRNEIARTDDSIADLKGKQMITRTFIEVKKLDYPKTVCGESSCVTVWDVNDIKTTEYRTVCHAHCSLKDVQADTIGDRKLTKCKAMYNGKCMSCSHSYRQHLHVYYDSVQVAKKVPDQSVVELLQQNLSAREMKAKMIEAKNQEIQEYENELRKIEQSSVKFAYFLKKNAITPYNDAMEQYLNHLIGEEKEKVAMGGSRATLDSLVDSRDSYLKEKDLLEQQMSMEGEDGFNVPPGPKEVDQLVNVLKALKHSGKALKEALECVEYTQKFVYRETVVKPQTWRRRGQGHSNNASRRTGFLNFFRGNSRNEKQ